MSIASIAAFYPPRYQPYRKRQEPTWLEALYAWRDRTRSKLTWVEEFRREKNNVVTHIMTPVLTCTVYENPDEDTQMYLRRAANNPADALEGAKSAVRSRLGRGLLLEFYGRVEDSGEEKSHCRYTVVDISYTYVLDNRPITECRAMGSTKNDARQRAARQLLESGVYCMFSRKSKRMH
ncbi:hypothetical protein RSOLAG22IIIB_00732 [Rhizoctonia solani]|uniref:Uncharacterized protein n=1 Tax=Rhizoctonia solani TaxID=456999 RepID=A0A0K6FWL8_9AGAM|nr:hypothetical protein RSOLAG22IIIB_00732 [Rhizoctonia solani]